MRNKTASRNTPEYLRNIPRNLAEGKMKTQKETLSALCKIIKCSRLNVSTVCRNKNGRLGKMAVGTDSSVFIKKHLFLFFIIKDYVHEFP